MMPESDTAAPVINAAPITVCTRNAPTDTPILAAVSSPVIKTSSRLPADNKIRKPGNITAIAATGDEKPASARLPDSHVVALRNTKSSDKNKIMLTTAPENALNTNPNTSNPKVPPPSSLCTAKISRHTPNAPRKAAAGTPIAPPPKANSTITPKAAPPDVPIKLGSASGFSNKACNAAPEADKPAPTKSAV